MTPKEIRESGDYYNHHTASRRGYMSRRNGGTETAEPYRGRFGEGYRILSCRWDTTQHISVSYWIRKEVQND